MEGEIVEALPNTMFKVEAGQRARGPGPHLGQDAAALHPHPARRPGQDRAVAVRPRSRSDHVSIQVRVRNSAPGPRVGDPVMKRILLPPPVCSSRAGRARERVRPRRRAGRRRHGRSKPRAAREPLRAACRSPGSRAAPGEEEPVPTPAQRLHRGVHGHAARAPAEQIDSFNDNFGGSPAGAPGRSPPGRHPQDATEPPPARGSREVFSVEDYLGSSPTFVLKEPLRVRKGNCRGSRSLPGRRCSPPI